MKQDRFTTCFNTCGTGSLFRGVEWGFVLAGKKRIFRERSKQTYFWREKLRISNVERQMLNDERFN